MIRNWIDLISGVIETVAMELSHALHKPERI
jgi:hypothetical protein